MSSNSETISSLPYNHRRPKWNLPAVICQLRTDFRIKKHPINLQPLWKCFQPIPALKTPKLQEFPAVSVFFSYFYCGQKATYLVLSIITMDLSICLSIE